jgi:hypothetical protein
MDNSTRNSEDNHSVGSSISGSSVANSTVDNSTHNHVHNHFYLVQEKDMLELLPNGLNKVDERSENAIPLNVLESLKVFIKSMLDDKGFSVFSLHTENGNIIEFNRDDMPEILHRIDEILRAYKQLRNIDIHRESLYRVKKTAILVVIEESIYNR